MEHDAQKAKRVRDYFDEIRNLTQFVDCRSIGVNTRGSTGDTPLKVAVVRSDVSLVSDLLAIGADPNVQGEDDYAPLHHAVVAGDAVIVRLLLDHGASPRLRDFEGRTAVEVAQIMGHDGVLRILEEHHAA